jgi:hypothetical protein
MLINQVNTATNANSALSVISMPAYDKHEYLVVLATTNEPRVSLNWTSNAPLKDPDCTFPADCPANANLNDLPFILDSGAMCHISPLASDFKVL